MAHAEWPNDRNAYQLQQCIGLGASSSVWEALCIPLNTAVAVKVIDMEGMTSTFEEIRVFCVAIVLLSNTIEQKEVQLLSMSNHPNVVTYHTSFVDGHHLWLVMKYFGGGMFIVAISRLNCFQVRFWTSCDTSSRKA